MANREQRRRQKRNKSSQPKSPVNVFNSKKLNQLADDKMIWASMGILGVVVLIVIGALIVNAIIH